MAYRLEAITLCTRGPVNTSAMRELWGDIEQGKLPILFDSEHNFAVGVSPVLKYSDYSVDDKSKFTLSILGVTKTFFYALEQKAQAGIYKKYDYSSDTFDLEECSKRAWECVNADQANGIISRAFTLLTTLKVRFQKNTQRTAEFTAIFIFRLFRNIEFIPY